jgi:hypothetical protein
VALLNGLVFFAISGDVTSYFYDFDDLPTALYDPATQTFLQAGVMKLLHEAGTATLLKDGRVLIAGGYHGDRILKSAEIYNPATTNPSPLAADMVLQRDLHRATLLRDGRVLITGGRTAGSWEPLVADTLAELFIPESTQGAVPRLWFDRSRYCAGDSWSLQAEAVQPVTAVQISGTWDETPWTVPSWAISDRDGTLASTGTFGGDTIGNYLIWIQAGGKVSNTVPISIENCSVHPD